ncbi:MAG TPA: trypsin-like peptidase domain-containing protein [Ktedonobacteraceae bacterium]|jgi:V8-like Glu-specific endopeptidase
MDMITLREALAMLFDTQQSSRLVARDAKLNLARIPFGATIQYTWQAILDEAEKQGKTADVIGVALKDYPNNRVLSQLQRSIIHSGTDDQPITDDQLSWKSIRTADVLEKIMGMQDTFLPISWFETGIQRSRCVVRIKRHDHTIGTGFLVKQNCILTNHHVLPTKDIAKHAIIQFNYQKSADGLDYEPTNFQLDPDAGFQTSSINDWTLVCVKGEANSQWGAIELRPVEIKVNGYANIIQHPAGEAKKLACYHNVIAYVDDTRIQYLTDTLPGSSGSAVFDSQWNIIALHHAGGQLREPTTQRVVYRNEGININCIIQELHDKLLLRN